MSCTTCDLCVARELNCHPWEIYWGRDSLKSKLFKAKPGLQIWEYELWANFYANNKIPDEEAVASFTKSSKLNYTAYGNPSPDTPSPDTPSPD